MLLLLLLDDEEKKVLLARPDLGDISILLLGDVGVDGVVAPPDDVFVKLLGDENILIRSLTLFEDKSLTPFLMGDLGVPGAVAEPCCCCC